MKIVVIGGRKAWLEDAPDPSPEGEWVVARTLLTPICGSDMGGFLTEGEHRGYGHEGIGEVVAAAAGARVRLGERVVLNPASGCGRCPACRSGEYIYCGEKPPSSGHFTQFVRLQDWLCVPIPDEIPNPLAALTGCGLAPAANLMRRLRVGATDTVLVTGLGPVGLGAVALACFRNARVIAVDPVPWRRERASQLGAAEVLDPTGSDLRETIPARPAGAGPGVCIECSGRPDAERLCVDVAGVRGRVGFIGENHTGVEISPSAMIRRGIEIHAAWHCGLTDFPDLFTFLRRFPRAELLVSHTFPFSRVQEAFETFAGHDAAKVLLDPWA